MAASGIVTSGIRERFQSVLEKVASSWAVTPDGSLSSSEFSIHFYEAALVQLLQREGTNLSETEFVQCVSGAARDLVKTGKVSVDEFNKAFSHRASLVLKKRKKKYFAICRLGFSIHGEFWVPIDFMGIRACICKDPPPNMDTSEFFLSGHGRVNPNEPLHGLFLIVGPRSSRSSAGALDALSDDINAILGLIALWVGYSRLTHHIGEIRPLTNIRPGKNITIYNENLTRVEDFMGYFTDYAENAKILSRRDQDILSYVVNVAPSYCILDKPRREYFATALRLYHDAVTERHPDAQVTKLWKLAEFATFSEGGRVEQIAKRLALTWEDRDFIYAVASAAGQRRNTIAHHSGSGVSAEEISEYFRYILGVFLVRAISKKIKNLSSWRSVLEIGSSKFDLGSLGDAVKFLESISKNKN